MTTIPRSISSCCYLPVERLGTQYVCTGCGAVVFKDRKEEQMKITEIRIDRTKSLGNYENLKLGFTAVVDEGERPADAIDRVRRLLDWEINLEEREIQYRAKATRLAHIRRVLAGDEANGKADDLKVEAGTIETWLARFDARKTEFASDEWK